MNWALLCTALVAAGLGAAGGYYLAAHEARHAAPKPLFYRHPMNPAVTSPVPAKDEMGMDYVPVYEDHPPPQAEGATPSAGGTGKPERRILYYRHPMGLPDTSPVPKKDAMGMDYIPVYADEEGTEGGPVVQVGREKIQRLGVRTAPAEYAPLARTVRGVGIVEPDERRLYTVTLRFDGFIEKLYVATTGQAVTRGQPLFELYSPELVSAQREYLTARSAAAALAGSEPWVQAGMRELAASGLERLRNFGIAEAELADLERRGEARHALLVRSPATGVVLEKAAVAGVQAKAGDVLFKIADLSQVWVVAEIYEQDLGLLAPGQTVRARLDAYPGRQFGGRVAFLYPTLDAATRTARARIELPNPQGLLKPMMYARLEIDTGAHRALVVPRSAVLEGGRRTLVLVERGEGRFEPRPVRLGLRGEENYEILDGLRAGERVVVGANFLIDAESNLKAALDSLGPAETPPAAPPPGGHDGHGGK